MNSVYQTNINLFKQRFPSLCESVNFDAELKFDEIEVFEAKNKMLSASLNLDGKKIFLHSKYDPLKEAQGLISKFDSKKNKSVVFLGVGLGYAVLEFARKYPDVFIIVIENSLERLLFALSYIDWSDLFKHQKLIIAPGILSEQLNGLLSGFKYSSMEIFKTSQYTAHDEKYFSVLEELILKNKEKESINDATLEKFSKLWTSNSLKNLDKMGALDGIEKFYQKGKNLPVVVLAAGPSLEKVLPHLTEIKKRAIIVCVDTSVHACLNAGVEPDFILLCDPQYYCAMHLEFLRSPSSIMITEIASYPIAFNFDCKEICLCTSMFPLGQYFEKSLGFNGILRAGGSVTTTAWDFGVFLGSNEIFLAGMDLGFPDKQTHIRGSQFEQKSHFCSSRFNSSEKTDCASLFSAAPFIAEDYNGNKILTDKKMSMFSWWFEVNAKAAKEKGIFTWTLTAESLKIDGIEKYSLDDFLNKKIIVDEKNRLLNLDFSFDKANKNKLLNEKKKELKSGLEFLKSLCEQGLADCSKNHSSVENIQKIFVELDKIDSQIYSSSVKDICALVFPNQKRLDKEFEKIDLNQDSPLSKALYSLGCSKIIYSQLNSSIQEILSKL